MKSDSRKHVAMTGDSAYLYPLGVAISSLARHTELPVGLDFVVPRDWSQMIDAQDLRLIEDLVLSYGWSFQVIVTAIDAENLPRTRHISSMTFMKPAYFDVSDHEQVVFLDGDLIAIGDWSPLFDPMPDFLSIEAAREPNMQDFERKWAPHLEPGWYINAGVLKARPKLWQGRHGRRWMELLAEFEEHDFQLLEQDIMNATLLGTAGLISPDLNFRPAYCDDAYSPVIVHFAGWWKPWLTVPAEVRRLPINLQGTYKQFASAEQEFHDHVATKLGHEAAAQWQKSKNKVRGRVSWRSHRRYLRWALGQRVKQIRKQFPKLP